MKWFINRLFPHRIPPREEFRQPITTWDSPAAPLASLQRPMPSQDELKAKIQDYMSDGLDMKQALFKVAQDYPGRDNAELWNILNGPKKVAEPTKSNLNIKHLIQRNINILRMVIGISFIVPGLFLITDSYMQMRVGVFYRTIINKPFYFTIGILLLISGAIILAKGVREYLR